MNAYVVDTNVPIVANGRTAQASAECVLRCISALDDARNGITCLDSLGLILREYMNNLSMSGQPGVGDAFMKWVFENQANENHCEQVSVTLLDRVEQEFEEFPDDSDLVDFDRSDRKFVAVAVASRHSPAILNATDSDWWESREALEQCGIEVVFVCDDQFSS